MNEEMKHHNEVISHEEECWYRIKSLNHNITLKEFYEIINQPDFDIENYEISKRIQMEHEKDIDKARLREIFLRGDKEIKRKEVELEEV